MELGSDRIKERNVYLFVLQKCMRDKAQSFDKNTFYDFIYYDKNIFLYINFVRLLTCKSPMNVLHM